MDRLRITISLLVALAVTTAPVVARAVVNPSSPASADCSASPATPDQEGANDDAATAGETTTSSVSTVPGDTLASDEACVTGAVPAATDAAAAVTQPATVDPDNVNAAALSAQGDVLTLPAISDVTDGIFTISSAINGLVLDDPGASSASGARFQLWSANGSVAQRFHIVTSDDGRYCTIVNVASGLVLDVEGASNIAGTHVQQYADNGTDAQRWVIHENGDGTYTIFSKIRSSDGSLLVLDVPGADAYEGATVQSWDANDTEAQRWNVSREQRAIDDGSYSLSSSLPSSRALDVEGASRSEGANIEIWEANRSAAQVFCFTYDSWTGYYQVVNTNSGLALDVEGASGTSGANVRLWGQNGSWAQRWDVRSNGDGTFSLVSAVSGKSLDVEGAADVNGANVQQWYSNGSAAQRWRISPSSGFIEDGVYILRSALDPSKVVDVACNGTTAGTNVRLWGQNGTSAQEYRIRFDAQTGYYEVTSASSGLALDVEGGYAWDGANVQVWDRNAGLNQRWNIFSNGDGTYTFVSAASGESLDVCGANPSEGTNIQQWSKNGTAAQRWILDRPSGSAQSIEPGVYSIVCAADRQLVFDAENGGTANGTNLWVCTSNGTAAQRYCISPADGHDGYYTIANQASGLLVTEGRGDNGRNLGFEVAAPSGPETAQLWKLVPADDGIAFVDAGGRAIDVSGASFVAGTNLQVWPANGTPAQSFVLMGVSNDETGSVVGFSSTADSSRIESTRIGSTYHLFLPASSDLSQLRLSCYSTLAQPVLVSTAGDGTYSAFVSGDALDLVSMGIDPSATSVDLYVKASETSFPQHLAIQRSRGVATMYLSSADPVEQGRAYVEASSDHTASTTGSLLMVGAGGDTVYDGSLTQIKGRGNSTWRYSQKKPYQIKLKTKTDLLQLGSKSESKANRGKTWVLLANQDDETLLHESVAKELALELGLSETPQCRPVDLYYDGQYRGSYLLSEKVQIGSGRVDVSDDVEDENVAANEASAGGEDEVEGYLSSLGAGYGVNAYGYVYKYTRGMATPASLATGVPEGYLLELDSAWYSGERCWIKTSVGPFTSKGTDYLSETEARNLSEFVQEALDCVSNGGVNPRTGKKTSDYFDLDSLAKVYLVEELSKNVDFCDYSSTYFYTKASPDGTVRLYCGPVWDFDSAFGFNNMGKLNLPDMTKPTGYYAKRACFYASDQAVMARIKSLYTQDLLSSVLSSDDTDTSSILGMARRLSASQSMNQTLWGLGTNMFGGASHSSYSAAVVDFRSWLTRRDAWLRPAIQGW